LPFIIIGSLPGMRKELYQWASRLQYSCWAQPRIGAVHVSTIQAGPCSVHHQTVSMVPFTK
jgi:hypothetical protein